MRPVNKGTSPYVTIPSYQHARGHLIDRIGEYCSYCERKIPASLAVEHLRPKYHNPTLELVWDNLLLACTNCNSTKSSTNVVLTDYVWPHLDDSLNYFVYTQSSLIEVNPNLPPAQQQRVARTLTLIGLNKRPSESDTVRSNRLWKHRLEAWGKAEIQKDRYENAEDKVKALEFIVDVAVDNGFFSVWMTVFNAFPEVQAELIANHIGTNL